MLDFSNMDEFGFHGGSSRKPKTRMAGDYMADFTKSNSTPDTPDTPSVNTFESSQNKLNDSFYMDYDSFNESSPTTSTDSGEKTIYSVPEIYAKYAKMDQEQTGSGADQNQGSIDLYYKGQEEIKRLARAGQLVDKNGNPVSY